MLNDEKMILRTVVPVWKGQPQCQPLVSTREFGRWVRDTFGQTNPEVVLAATHITNRDGYPNHPGAYLNNFFRTHPTVLRENRQRSFKIDSEFVIECIKLGIVEIGDANKLVGAESNHKVWIKFYTQTQIEIAMTALLKGMGDVGQGFAFHHHVGVPIQIKCVEQPYWESDKLYGPKQKAKSLFSVSSPVTPRVEPEPVKLTRTQQKWQNIVSIGIVQGVETIYLHKVNNLGPKFEYLSVKTNWDTGIITLCRADVSWYDAKIRQDGHSFGLGKDFFRKRGRPNLPKRSYYRLEYNKQMDEFYIYLKEPVECPNLKK